MTTEEGSVPPVAAFVVDPPEPSAGRPVRLLDLSYDPSGAGIALHAWDLGDGTTSTAPSPEHRFALDGAYDVTLRVTTADGRMATTATCVRVASHDVTLTRIAAPESTTVDGAGEVVVAVESRHGPEIVQIELLRALGEGAPETVALQTVSLAEAREHKIAFPVNFADVQAGEVTFRARVSLVGATDLRPIDNELTAPPTRVTERPAPCRSG